MTTQASISWNEGGEARTALWRSESAMAMPKNVIIADDQMPADVAYRHALAGTALLWRGDFQNARQLLQALARRIDHKPARAKRARAGKAPPTPTESFHLHRLAQSQRARTLAMLLVPFEDDYIIPLRRAPDVRQACNEAYGKYQQPFVASLRELLGSIGAHEWRRNGVPVASLGANIHPWHGVFSPVRGEYVQLVAEAPLPPGTSLAFDVGTGTGVLAAVLAQRGIARVVATDMDARALGCARENIDRLRLGGQVEVVQADLFPDGRAPRGGVQSALAAGQAEFVDRIRRLRSRQPHAARIPGRPGRPPGARRRGLADPVRLCRASRPAFARDAA